MAMLQDFGMIKKETIKRSTDSTQWLLVYQPLVRQDGETSQLDKRKWRDIRQTLRKLCIFAIDYRSVLDPSFQILPLRLHRQLVWSPGDE